MSDLLTGRISGIFSAGAKVEESLEAYEKEADSLENMKVAFAMAGKRLNDLKAEVESNLASAKISLKESEYAKVYLTKSIVLIEQLFNETEAKKLQAIGAINALKGSVNTVKKMWNEEQAKRTQILEYESKEIVTTEDIKNRPIGAYPGDPLKELKSQSKSKKKTTKKET